MDIWTEGHGMSYYQSYQGLQKIKRPSSQKNNLENARWMIRASRKLEGQFPEDVNLEHYFHAALHLVWMVLEGKRSICLVAAKRPSNTVPDPREESAAVGV